MAIKINSRVFADFLIVQVRDLGIKMVTKLMGYITVARSHKSQ